MTSAVPYAEVIGEPVGHSKSPAIHRFWLEKLGLPGTYRATRVGPEDLAAYLAERREDPLWRGCNITMPLKRLAARLVDDPAGSEEAINLALPRDGRLLGSNTDVQGILEPLRALQREAGGGSAVVLGGGGVVQSVLRALRSLGYGPIQLVVRDEAKVASLLGEDGGEVELRSWGSPLPPCDLLVNATPLGMRGQGELPYDAAAVREGGIVFDMVYQPLVTPLLADAGERGLRTVDGLQMLVAQAAPSFAGFFGQDPPREHDGELRAVLTR